MPNCTRVPATISGDAGPALIERRGTRTRVPYSVRGGIRAVLAQSLLRLQGRLWMSQMALSEVFAK